MSDLNTCPVCNGQGFIIKWDNDKVPPVHNRCDCVRCGGRGSATDPQDKYGPDRLTAWWNGYNAARDELVRCERCESWKPMDNGVGFCQNREGLFRMTHEHEFCCCGKEKEDV